MFEGFSSPDEFVDRDVEKCLDDGARGRVVVGAIGVAVEAVFVVFPLAVEFARNRDVEWLEK